MSRADVQVLTRSFRSRVLLLGVLVTAGLGAAVWSGTRDAGIGEPEDRQQLMIVTGQPHGPVPMDYYDVLGRAGFELAVEDYDDWLEAARLAAPESEAEGVALVLEHADRLGVGLVVFERALNLDFSGLEIEPALTSIERLDERDYLVLSVGDFGFPHRLSVDEPGDPPHLRLPGYGALEAVFAQDLITRREDQDRPTVEELQFEAATALGREMAARPAGFPATVEATRREVESDLDDRSGAVALVPTLSTGTAIPTPDGGVLLFHHDLEIFSDDARTLDIDPGDAMGISWLDREALAAGLGSGSFEREACPSLFGGSLALADLPRLAAAIDGSAIAMGSSEVETVVWRKQGPGCSWAPIAELEVSGPVVLAPDFAEDPARGPIRSVAAQADGARVLVWSASGTSEAGIPGPLLDPVTSIEQDGRRFASVVFLDDRHLAVSSERIDGEGQPPTDGRIYLLDRERPGVYLSVPVEFFARDRRVRELLAISPGTEATGPQLLVVALDREGRVELIRLGIAAAVWAEFEAEVEATDPVMVSLIPEDLESAQIVVADRLYGVSVAGGVVVYASSNGLDRSELFAHDLDSGRVQQLTVNGIRDYLPRLTRDGTSVAFVSLVSVDISATPFSVPRMLELPRQAPAEPETTN